MEPTALLAAIALVPQPAKLVETGGTAPAAADVRYIEDASIPAEGYRLSVAADGIEIASADDAGRFYAGVTLKQLALPDGSLPCVEIEDSPAFPWRGMHLDVSRHFFGVDDVKRFLDLMAEHKLNRFHWHLTDSQGWRLDVPSHPELAAASASRNGRKDEAEETFAQGDRFFYTETDVRDVLAYAAARHIEVVPEIELPGHFGGVLSAHPEFACVDADGKRIGWNEICAGNDAALALVEDVLDDICRMFPFDVVHIGGDECSRKKWAACPRCQARIQDEGLADEDELQAWISRRMVRFLEARGKRAIGWDEYLLGGGVPSSAIGMRWRGGGGAGGGPSNFVSAAAMAAAGHDLVMAGSRWVYFDYPQGLADDPCRYTFPSTPEKPRDKPLSRVYEFDPLRDIPPELHHRVLGGEGCNWTETTPTRGILEWKMWPRACALAECVWCGADRKPSYADFLRRLEVHRARLVAAGVNAAPIPPPDIASAANAATLEPGRTEVVVAPDAPKTVLFAAEEATNFLSRALGAPVPIATAPSEGMTAVFLGSNEWTRAAGIDTAPMARDAFAIVARDGAVFVAGRDDPAADTRRAIESPKAGVWAQLHEHATLFGVYELLERFAGVRMYFPGELGTVIPGTDRIEVPEGRIDVAPDFLVRNYSNYDDGPWFEGEDRALYKHPLKKLNYVRQRMQTQYVPCCHGTSYFGLQRRFAAEHPEYFALFEKKGALVRDTNTAETAHHPGQLCHSSAVYDEILADILSYERGDGPEVRGIVDADGWPLMAFRRPWVDVMPQDGFVECLCDKCRASYDKSEKHYATELIWRRTAELANRLAATGSAIRITQMAYPPYRRIPSIDIPGNVDVMVAETGPWSVENPDELAQEQAEIRAWSAKLGRPVWIWVYPNKFGNRFVPDVPNGTPRAWASYVQAVAPSIFGVFAECENDRFLYNSLCYYVLGKVCWDADADVEAILDEYFRLMFGAGAGPMAAFFADIEDKWLRGVRGVFVDGPLGPERQTPSEYQIFARVYDAATLERWDAWLRDAAARVPEGSLEARRVALFRRELFDPLAAHVADYVASISVERELARRAASPATNLLANGDFSAPPAPGAAPRRRYGLYDDPERGRGWRGGWDCAEEAVPFLSLMDDVPPGAHGKALRMTVEGESRIVRVENAFSRFNGKYEPGRRYRVSFFVRLTDVVSHGNGGVGVRVWHDRNEWFPRNRITGTTGWIHQEYFFTAGAKSADFDSQFAIHLWNATGTVDWADFRVEPVD